MRSSGLYPRQRTRNYVDNSAFEVSTTAGYTATTNVQVGNAAAAISGGQTSRFSIITTTSGAGNITTELGALDENHRGKQLTLEFDYKSGAGYASDDFNLVVVYDPTGTPATITPSVTNIPASTNVTRFAVTFLSQSGSLGYQLKWSRKTTVATITNNYLDIDNITVTASEIVQGVPVTEWTSFTPTFTNVSVGNGTATGFWKRVGDNMDVRATLVFGSTTSVSGTIAVNIPPPGLSLTTDTTKLVNNNDYGLLGHAHASDGGATFYHDSAVLDGPTRIITRVDGGGTSVWNATTPFTWGTGDAFTFQFSIPIAEWAGSTVGLANSRVEYASNSSTSTASGDTTSFAYGPAGNQIQNITTTLDRTVRFQNPIQSTDVLQIEIREAGSNTWHPITTTMINIGSGGAGAIQPLIILNNVSYGIGLLPGANTNEMIVRFGQYTTSAPAATYGAAGQAYSAGVGACFWRVSKSSNPLSIGSELTTPWQKKTAGVDYSTTGDKTELSFSNLEVGKTYRVFSWIRTDVTTDADLIATVQIRDTLGGAGTLLAQMTSVIHPQDAGVQQLEFNTGDELSLSTSTIFVAATTSVVTRISAIGPASRVRSDSYIILEELPHHIVTTKWT